MPARVLVVVTDTGSRVPRAKEIWRLWRAARHRWWRVQCIYTPTMVLIIGKAVAHTMPTVDHLTQAHKSWNAVLT